jgi:cyanophycinase
MIRIIVFRFLFVTAVCTICISCRNNINEGKLFIMGGGDLPASLIDKMIEVSGIDKGGYGVILPMASTIPDTALMYSIAYFTGRGRDNVFGLNFEKGKPYSQARIDSIRNAKMVYISGGDQSKFMDDIAGTPIKQAIHEAYEKGGLICGTSAGAAVMSKRMITGNELKHPDPEISFNTMEAKNVEITEGLGMLENTIIDQHFIVRKRLNRLISACIENPGYMCVGIDEPTAILVEGDKATVYGDTQVIVVQHPSAVKVENGLLGARKIQIDVYLPGENFRIKR